MTDEEYELRDAIEKTWSVLLYLEYRLADVCSPFEVDDKFTISSSAEVIDAKTQKVVGTILELVGSVTAEMRAAEPAKFVGKLLKVTEVHPRPEKPFFELMIEDEEGLLDARLVMNPKSDFEENDNDG